MRRYAVLGRLMAAAALLAAVVLILPPRPAHALDTGAAVGIGLGSFALGSALGAAANPYYRPYPYGYGYGYPAPAYYPPAAPYYPPQRSCWDPYSRVYYAC
jgi:hypothetical protein